MIYAQQIIELSFIYNNSNYEEVEKYYSPELL